METIGKKVLKMDFYKGFSCQFATANCIILGTRLGLPLSTTHCTVGSIFGIALASKISLCVNAYKYMQKLDIFEAESYKDKNEPLIKEAK
jgi:phosphate/sulfate permease